VVYQRQPATPVAPTITENELELPMYKPFLGLTVGNYGYLAPLYHQSRHFKAPTSAPTLEAGGGVRVLSTCAFRPSPRQAGTTPVAEREEEGRGG
jgi:hypothetical protein